MRILRAEPLAPVPSAPVPLQTSWQVFQCSPLRCSALFREYLRHGPWLGLVASDGKSHSCS